MTPKDLVLHATAELFGNRDLSAIDRYWAAGYVEHSALAGPGLHGLREAADSLPAGCTTGSAPSRSSDATCGGWRTARSSNTGTRVSHGSTSRYQATR
jgi:hypothetical protein